jgi:hypothetical protein
MKKLTTRKLISLALTAALLLATGVHAITEGGSVNRSDCPDCRSEPSYVGGIEEEFRHWLDANGWTEEDFRCGDTSGWTEEHFRFDGAGLLNRPPQEPEELPRNWVDTTGWTEEDFRLDGRNERNPSPQKPDGYVSDEVLPEWHGVVHYTTFDADGNEVESGTIDHTFERFTDKGEAEEGLREFPASNVTIPVAGGVTFRPYIYQNGWVTPGNWWLCAAYELSTAGSITVQYANTTARLPGTYIENYGPDARSLMAYGQRVATTGYYAVTLYNDSTTDAAVVTKFETFITGNDRAASDWWNARRP